MALTNKTVDQMKLLEKKVSARYLWERDGIDKKAPYSRKHIRKQMIKLVKAIGKEWKKDDQSRTY